MSDSSKNSYRSIMRATSVFGGVQIFQILINIIRSKFIAVLLGPIGMGISGLFQSSIGVVASLTNFGLSTSAVKNIASAEALNDHVKISRVRSVLNKLAITTGIFGTILTLIFSPYLSKITFGNDEYIWAFAILSITLFLNQITAEQNILLQGMRKMKLLAQSTILGSLFGLITTIPIYYYYGKNGIVPSILITAIIATILSKYYASKLSIKSVNISLKDSIIEGKEMLYMGFMIGLNGIIVLTFSYIVRIFIKTYGTFEDVGLYNAGFAILNTYVGMIFNAMATDYFPRLSSVSKDYVKSNEIINQQAEVSIMILSPILIIFIVFIKAIIFILYSKAFYPIQNMILFAAYGMLFKALSWSIAFIFLAKSSSKLFFWNELISNIYILILNLLGYYYYGLTGLGISFLISYFLYTIQVFIVSKKMFKFSFNKSLINIFLINIFIATLSLLTAIYSRNSNTLYFWGLIYICISFIFNFYNLEKKISLREFIYNKWQKK